MSLKEFKKKETIKLKEYRTSYRDNYTFLETYCKKEFNSGNYLDLLSKKTNLIEQNSREIKEIVEQDYIKSNNYDFKVTPDVQNATDFLRIELLGMQGKHNYKKSTERAVYEILQQIRDNLTHYGKFEVSNEQFDRNFILIKNASIISSSLIKILEENG
tara:strand:+ start:5293 stop:5769 length:477 start_codon:yes stop_codon:yes gene_type:complete